MFANDSKSDSRREMLISDIAARTHDFGSRKYTLSILKHLEIHISWKDIPEDWTSSRSVSEIVEFRKCFASAIPQLLKKKSSDITPL